MTEKQTILIADDEPEIRDVLLYDAFRRRI